MSLIPPFIKYQRRSKVDFLGNEKYKPLKGTYIWAILIDPQYSVAYIQHGEGLLKSEFEAKPPFAYHVLDGVPDPRPSIPDSHFDPTERYIEVLEGEIVFSDEKERAERNQIIRESIADLHRRLSR